MANYISRFKPGLTPDNYMLTAALSVRTMGSSINKKLAALKKRYEKNPSVLLCDSLQSIEYWFLLHYEDTCRYFKDSAATEQALKRYIPTYDKTRKYLEKKKWVKDLIADGKMDKACELAEKYDGKDSYSGMYKAIKTLSKQVSYLI